MGRWQSEYYDQVLGSKLKSLVCGAISRASLEKDEAPTISYESFVQDLDHGDSFTTTLVDILVKELADRKTRPSSPDRHLIAERTVKNLRHLALTRIYRDRSTAARHSFANDFFVSQTGGGGTSLDWDVLTQNADDDEVDVEDVMPPGDGMHRFNPADPVYHPFTDSSSSTATIRRSFPVQTTDAGGDDDSPVHQLGYPTRRSPPAHFSLARHSSLSRQPSIRRPPRSRTNDFNEFTTRRRLSGRYDPSSQSGPGSSSRASTSGAGESSSSMDIANLLHSHHGNIGSEVDGAMPATTFDSTSTSGRPSVTRVRSSDEREGSSGESSSSTRLNSVTLHTSGSTIPAAPSSSRLHANAPRLRRSGIRAPEQLVAASPTSGDGYMHTVRISSPPIPGLHSLSHREDEQRLPLLRRSSSAEMEYIIQTASERFGSRSPRSGSPSTWGGPWNVTAGNSGAGASGSSARQPTGTPTNLPTPRSISPEGSSTRD